MQLARRRALTLFELLITLAILIGMAGLSYVAVQPMLDAARLSAAGRGVEQHLQMARAHARLSGRPVVVRASQQDDGRMLVESRTLSVFGDRSAGLLAGEADADTLRGIVGALEPEEADAEAELVAGATIFESWALLRLADRVRLDRVPPGASPMGLRPMWMDEAVPRGPQAVQLVLAVYLPDGSVIGAHAFFVIDDRERAVEVRIEPWTGRVRTLPWSDDPFAEQDLLEADEASMEEAPPSRDMIGFGTLLFGMIGGRRGPRGVRTRTRRGAVLMETLVALAIFIAVAVITLGITSSAIETVTRDQLRSMAHDLAQSRFAELRAGTVTFAELRDPATALRQVGSVDRTGMPEGEILWQLRAASRPSGHAGYGLVTLTVRGTSSDGRILADAVVRGVLLLDDADIEAYADDDLLDGLPEANDFSEGFP